MPREESQADDGRTLANLTSNHKRKQKPRQNKVPFASHRPKSTLLIPSKRPLSSSSSSSSSSHQFTSSRSGSGSAAVPTLIIRSAAQTSQTEAEIRDVEKKNKRRIEANFSAAPQPFLDPELWEKLQNGFDEFPL